MRTKVALMRCMDYKDTEIKEAILESLVSLKIERLVEKNQTVLVKPNMFQGFSPEKCGTTHPSIIKAIIQILQSLGAEVLVGDNPACLKSRSVNRYMEIAEITGIKKVAEETGAALVYPDEAIENSGWIVSKILLEVDVVINVPKLKGHGLMGLTGGVKNIFGLVPGLRKLSYHAELKKRDQFAEMLVDLCTFIKPQLTVMDAIEIVDKEGSIVRKSKPIGAIISSRNPFAADLVATKLLRLHPMSIPTTAIALKKGLLNLGEVEIVRENLERFRLPKLNFLLNTSFRPKPQKSKGSIFPKIDKQRCATCGACVMICPTLAIQVEKEELIIQKGLCSKCYCCLEVCQFSALSLLD